MHKFQARFQASAPKNGLVRSPEHIAWAGQAIFEAATGSDCALAKAQHALRASHRPMPLSLFKASGAITAQNIKEGRRKGSTRLGCPKVSSGWGRFAYEEKLAWDAIAFLNALKRVDQASITGGACASPERQKRLRRQLVGARSARSASSDLRIYLTWLKRWCPAWLARRASPSG